MFSFQLYVLNSINGCTAIPLKASCYFRINKPKKILSSTHVNTIWQILKRWHGDIYGINVNNYRHTPGFLRIECGTVNANNYKCNCDVTSVVVDGVIRGDNFIVSYFKPWMNVISWLDDYLRASFGASRWLFVRISAIQCSNRSI